jgi:hypothetical protein
MEHTEQIFMLIPLPPVASLQDAEFEILSLLQTIKRIRFNISDL